MIKKVSLRERGVYKYIYIYNEIDNTCKNVVQKLYGPASKPHSQISTYRNNIKIKK